MEREKNCISIHLIIHIFDTDDLRNADGVEKYHGVNAVKLDSKITELIFVINELFPIYARIPFSFFCLLFLVFFCLPPLLLDCSCCLSSAHTFNYYYHFSGLAPTTEIIVIQTYFGCSAYRANWMNSSEYSL